MSGATVRSRATEESSSTSSSPTVLTPSSDSASVAFSRDEADVRTFNPDDAIPSIEDNAASTLVSTTHRRQVGRVSLPAQGSAMSTPSRPVPEGSTSARPLNRQHAESDGNLHVSELFPAIEGVERGSDTPARSQSAPLQARSPRPSRASRRRSQPIHQVASEEPPPDRYHEPEFQNALSNAKRQMSRLVDTLASSSIHTEPDSRMQSLFGQALELACFQCPTTRTVGFVGDSGVGKSSLLNALLDQQALARVSNAGAACTCVVTEFRYHDQDDFVIQVDMFSDNELFDQVRSLVKAYRSFHHPDGDFESEDQRQVAQNMAQVAADTFTAMFRGHLDDFDVLIGEPEPIVMSKLLSLIGECRPNNLERRRTLSTFDSCRNLLGRLTSESPTTEGPAAWPYIHKVSVYLRAHILTGGLVMVDLPGLHDRNSARQLITETYLRECDEILAVCNIGRAVSDAGVKSVFDLARKARLSNVGIVCTKSDLDVELDESDTDLAEAADFIKLLAERLRWLDEEISDLLDDGDSSSAEELASLMRERQEKRVRINTAKFELDRTLINRRNAHVAAGLVELYSTQDRPIEVFCVSNTMYRKHRDEPGDVALPYLSLSGIISLRRHCISIVSRSQFRLAKHYIQDKIPALLIDLRLWVESGARSGIAERRAAIRTVLSDVEGRLERGLNGRASGVNTIARSLRQDFDNQIVTVGMLSTEQWRRGALNATRVWDGWAWATYAAFCRNYGDYWTDAVKGHVWNEEAMETMVGDLEAPWDELRSGLEDQFRNFVESVRETVENAADFMESRLEYSDSAAVVHSALDSRCQLLVTDLEDAWDQFERNLDGLRTDALSGIRTSFFGRAMEGAYNEARTFSGKGSHARRKMVINRTINSQDMFRGHMRTFSRRFDAIVTAFETGAREMVRTHLGGLRESLDMLRSENIAMESERDEAFRQRVQRAERSARQEMERIQTVATN